MISRHPTEQGRPFMISHRGEDDLMARAARSAYGLYIGAVLGVAGAIACFIAAYLF